MSKNIDIVVKSGLCIQCGVCYSICPQDAINFSDDIERLLYTTSDCINCGKCLKVCPGLSPLKAEENESLLGPVNTCYLGYSTNPKIRFKASSGGIIPALNIYLLQNNIIDGVICLRQSKESIYKNEAILITNDNDVLSASGSRYAPAFLCIGLKDLPLKKGGYYAIIGKPCDIQAAIKYNQLTKKLNFLKIAIFCAQTPSMSATQEILKQNNIDEKVVKNIHYRGDGWPGFFTIISGNKEVLLQKKYDDVWNKILCRRKFSNIRCFLCHDCTGENADISVGDAWIEEFKGKSDGHSFVITRSDIGDKYIRECIEKKILILEPTKSNIIIESQKNLLSKKENVFLKRFVAKLIGQKVPIEKIKYDRENNHLKKIAGFMKYFLLKKFGY